VIAWLKGYAQDRGLEWEQDTVGNIVIRRPGTGGGENAPAVIVQGHVDMVTEKNADTKHDFTTDPIRLVRDGDWITADGTTLGADNGIGVCAALALLDQPPSSKLPPLEALFTVDEETGLTGAFGLDGSMLQGRILLNLDTEEWPEVFIGCAGGGDSVLTLNASTEMVQPLADLHRVEITVTGLMGGHSGVDIHEDRGNAVRLAAATVDAVLRSVPGVRLASIEGGDKRNAIPRECRVTLYVPSNAQEATMDTVSQSSTDFKAEFGQRETGVSIKAFCHQSILPSAPVAVLLPGDADRLMSLLLTLPHGVIKYSHSVPGLVETSSNLASVRLTTAEGQPVATFRIQCSTRSSLMPALERTRGAIRRIAGMCGAGIEQDEAYPGWMPQPDAEIVGLARDAIADIAGRQPEVKAIHAGLECGILGEKLPGVQSVSYGPTIKGAHSPDERVQISTVAPFWEATLEILGKLAERRA